MTQLEVTFTESFSINISDNKFMHFFTFYQRPVLEVPNSPWPHSLISKATVKLIVVGMFYIDQRGIVINFMQASLMKLRYPKVFFF